MALRQTGRSFLDAYWVVGLWSSNSSFNLLQSLTDWLAGKESSGQTGLIRLLQLRLGLG